MNNFIINNVHPVRIEDIQRVVDEALRRHAGSRNPPIADQPTTQQIPQNNIFRTWMWGGKIRIVPEDFIFPSTDVKTVWRLWYYGNADLSIHPYRYRNAGMRMICEKKTQGEF